MPARTTRLAGFLIFGALTLGSLAPAPAAAQAAAAPGDSAKTASDARGSAAAPRVVVMNVALYNEGANVKEAIDTSRAHLSTQVLRGKLVELLGASVADSARVAQFANSAEAHAITGEKPCNVIVACVRETGRRLGADYAVMAKVSKTSNLIWLFTGQLIDLRTGEFLLDDSTELKGDPEPMVRAGTRSFAERVAREVRGELTSR